MPLINPKISIIVPIYNVENYLRECLDSLINQIFKDIEIICVNDGSTDGSVQILEEYRFKDKRIKVINKENSGYGHSMNVGIDHAIADYIGILESDDIAQPEMFNDLYSLITEYDCDFVKADYYLYYSLKNKKIPNKMVKEEDAFKVTNAKENPELLYLIPSIWSAIYKKDFLVKNDIKFLETPGASYQDTSFHNKVFMCADRILLSNKPYVYYRQDNKNSSVNSKSKVYCITDEYKEVHSYINRHSELEIFRPYIYDLQFRGYQWNMNRISDCFVQEFFEHFHNEFKSYSDNHLLSEIAIERINKKYDLNLFLNSPNKYIKKVIKKRKSQKWKEFRRNIIQIRLNKREKIIKIFGKELYSN
ncbi:glycosyltransferase family 2 protein [bacterium]|nr:glycosyltransferase family 2 protein [bacterium]